jgi:hypothetical protein
MPEYKKRKPPEWRRAFYFEILPEYDAIRTAAWADFRAWLMSPDSGKIAAVLASK